MIEVFIFLFFYLLKGLFEYLAILSVTLFRHLGDELPVEMIFGLGFYDTLSRDNLSGFGIS